MTDLTQGDTAPRNTFSDGEPSVTTRKRCWFGTWNNHSEANFAFLHDMAKMLCQDWAMQEEVGTSGTPHIQFCLKFKNARTFRSLKKKIPQAHLEVCKNWHACRSYCLKDDSYSGGRREQKLKREIYDPLDHVVLYDWQTEICELMKQPANERDIFWYWEKDGCAGKTTLARHLCIKYPKKVLYLGGKKADILYGIYEFLLEESNDLKMVILDFSRSLENFISWDAIESIKNGIFYNTKYKSAMCVFNYCHVVCFANFSPDIARLSEDRWRIKKINSLQ